PSPPAPRPLSLHDALPISPSAPPAIAAIVVPWNSRAPALPAALSRICDEAADAAPWMRTRRTIMPATPVQGLPRPEAGRAGGGRSEEHTSELQSQSNIVCR